MENCTYRDFDLIKAIQVKNPGEYLWGFPIWGYESVVEDGEIKVVLNGRLVDEDGSALVTYVDKENDDRRYICVNDEIRYLDEIKLTGGKEFEYMLVLEGAVETDFREYTAAGQWAIDTGWAWKAQGVFGRMCMALIDDGYCTKQYIEINKQKDTE